MKKILTLLVGISMAWGVNSYAADVLAAKTVSPEGISIFGAGNDTEVVLKKNKLVSFSKGVAGLVNYATTGTNNDQSNSYVIGCKHTSGSKISATSNDTTKLYWKQAGTGVMTADSFADDVDAAAFAAGNGWTEY